MQSNPDSDGHVALEDCPHFNGKVHVYHCASAIFYAPSDISGIGGMRRELIRALPSWRDGPPRYDCVFLNSDPSLEGMRGLSVVRVLLFFALPFQGKLHPAALVQWYTCVGDQPHQDTGMWAVELEKEGDKPAISVISLDSVIRAAHLLPIHREHRVPDGLTLADSLDAFHAFYVNKFADHHAFEIAF
jgi:hypothetical protein